MVVSAPLAPALALALLVAAPVAVNDTLPPACKKRKVVAVVVSGATVIAMAAPTATPEPAAAASAVLAVEPLWLALALKLPPMANSVPLPSVASVVFVGSDNATAGETAVPPPAPATTLVVITLFDAALRLTLLTPFGVTLSWICARLVLLTMLTATDAPTPTLLPSSPSTSRWRCSSSCSRR